MIRKYRKKPVVIQALEYLGCADLPIAKEFLRGTVAQYDPNDDSIVVPTLEGNMKAMPGDFIIRGVKGEFYPCKPDIFLATYDGVGDAD